MRSAAWNCRACIAALAWRRRSPSSGFWPRASVDTSPKSTARAVLLHRITLSCVGNPWPAHIVRNTRMLLRRVETIGVLERRNLSPPAPNALGSRGCRCVTQSLGRWGELRKSTQSGAPSHARHEIRRVIPRKPGGDQSRLLDHWPEHRPCAVGRGFRLRKYDRPALRGSRSRAHSECRGARFLAG